MSLPLIIFQIIVLVFSVMIHEVAHGFIALKLGDRTAQNAGRLNLNPLKHLDPFGSVILPLILAVIGAPILGWAKPVPYNPHNLKNPKIGAGLIAVAGPASNIALAIIFAIVIRLMGVFGLIAIAGGALFLLFNYIVIINLVLAIFNLIPIPPLDGSRILFSLLPAGRMERAMGFLNQYGFMILLILIFVGLSFLGPVVSWAHTFLVGPSFGIF